MEIVGNQEMCGELCLQLALWDSWRSWKIRRDKVGDVRLSPNCILHWRRRYTRLRRRYTRLLYLFTDISRVKNRKYQSGYHRRGIGFAPLPVSTFLGVGREVCHLLHRLAHFKVDAVSPDAALPSGSSAYAGADGKIVFARMLKELQYGIALASLVRLRGRDGFIDAA